MTDPRHVTPSEAAAALGRIKSDRKAEKCRENGAKGGRPKGIPMSEEAKAKIRAAWAKKRGEKEQAER